MNFFKGLGNGLRISLVLWLALFATTALAKTIAEKIITKPAVKEVTEWDTFRLLPTTLTAEIRTIKKKYNLEDKVVDSKAGNSIIYMDRVDNPATEEDETCTDFSDFLQKLGTSIGKISEAIVEMEE